MCVCVCVCVCVRTLLRISDSLLLCAQVAWWQVWGVIQKTGSPQPQLHERSLCSILLPSALLSQGLGHRGCVS